jgi:hypothetical protein
MALVFPVGPAIGDLYPPDPGVAGVTQYVYMGNNKWNAVPSSISLGSTNQGAFNQYQWPLTDGPVGTQLTTNGAGNLQWDVAAAPSMQILGLLEPFDGTQKAFTLVEAGTTTPFVPVPSTNIVVFLGGVPQIPFNSYGVTLATSTITFTEAPLAGTTFYAISNIVA